MKTSSSRERGQALLAGLNQKPNASSAIRNLQPEGKEAKPVKEDSRNGSISPTRSSIPSVTDQAKLTQKHLEYLKLFGKVLLGLLILMGIVALCRLIASTGILQPSIDLASKTIRGFRRDCDKELAAMTNFQGDDNQNKLAHQGVLTIPTSLPKSEIGNWFDESKSWDIGSFNTRAKELEQTHLKNLKYNSLPSSLWGKESAPAEGELEESVSEAESFGPKQSVVTEEVSQQAKPSSAKNQWGEKEFENSELLLADPFLVKRILNRLMAYTSEKYRLARVKAQGEDFLQHFQKHQLAYNQCRERVKSRQTEVVNLLKDHEKIPIEIQQVNNDIDKSVLTMQGYDADIDKKNFDLNKKIQDLTKEIDRITEFNHQLELAQSKLSQRNSERTVLELSLARSEPRYTELQGDPVVKEHQESTRTRDALMSRKLLLMGKKAMLEGRLEYAYDNKDLHSLITGLGQCDKSKLETLKLKLDEHHKGTETLEELLGKGEVYQVSLEDELYAKNITAELETIREKAGRFQHRRFDKEVAKIKTILREVESEAAEVEEKIISAEKKLGNLELRITDNRLEFQRLDAQRSAEQKDLSSLKEEMLELERITSERAGDTVGLLAERRGYESSLHGEIGELQGKKAQESAVHSGLLHRHTELTARAVASTRDVTRAVASLNVEVVACDSERVTLEEFNRRAAAANSKLKQDAHTLHSLKTELLAELRVAGLHNN